MRLFSLLLMTLSMLLGGCVAHEQERVPTYPEMDVPQALATMQSRNKQLKSMSGESAITLVDSRGRSVRLDGAFVLAPPDHARVRAWKFGQAVLDITVTPEGTWVYAPKNEGTDGEKQLMTERTGQAIRQWLKLLSGDFEDASTSVSGSQFILREQMADGLTLTTHINRDTLTPRMHVLRDGNGNQRFMLALDRYRAVGETVWPQRIEAKSETGRVLIEIRTLEPNDAPDLAFRPPARAVKVQ